jgi:hypothetical protein
MARSNLATLAARANASGWTHGVSMRPADARRTCQYPCPDNPGGVCGVRLSGRGRWKWCLLHAEITREIAKKAGNSLWQRAYRALHASDIKSKRRIDRAVSFIQKHLRDLLPDAKPNSLRSTLYETLRKALTRRASATINGVAIHLFLLNVHVDVFVRFLADQQVRPSGCSSLRDTFENCEAFRYLFSERDFLDFRWGRSNPRFSNFRIPKELVGQVLSLLFYVCVNLWRGKEFADVIPLFPSIRLLREPVYYCEYWDEKRNRIRRTLFGEFDKETQERLPDTWTPTWEEDPDQPLTKVLFQKALEFHLWKDSFVSKVSFTEH